MTDKAKTYKEAGVDVAAGQAAVKLIKSHVASTKRPEVISDIGGFSGLFSLENQNIDHPILAAATDGVGTKIQYARAAGKHNSIGIDLVAMVVNDLAASGADPLFFLDYIACGKLVPERIAEIVEGIAAGCRLAGCALLGGETAEHPGVMAEDDYDLAGFAVGMMNRPDIIDGAAALAIGDVAIALRSSGPHSNGYSLARAIVPPDDKALMADVIPGSNISWAQGLLEPTRIYTQSIAALRSGVRVKGVSHITGGGLRENIERLLPGDLDVTIDRAAWQVPLIFRGLQERGGIEDEAMFTAFNMGLGMMVFVAETETAAALASLVEVGEKPVVVGSVRPGNGRLILEP